MGSIIYINGDVGRSVFPSVPTDTNNSPSTEGIPHNFTSRFYRENNIFWQSGNAPASTNPSSPRLGNAKGNCTWYVNGRLQELGYNSAVLNRLHGDANLWDDQARNAGILISSTPQVGAIAQWEYGHVAVVEKVNADGTIVISQSSYSPNSGSPADYLYKPEESISAFSPSCYIIIPKNENNGSVIPINSSDPVFSVSNTSKQVFAGVDISVNVQVGSASGIGFIFGDQLILVNNSNSTQSLFKLNIPSDMLPGSYQLKVQYKNHNGVATSRDLGLIKIIPKYDPYPWNEILHQNYERLAKSTTDGVYNENPNMIMPGYHIDFRIGDSGAKGIYAVGLLSDDHRKPPVLVFRGTQPQYRCQ
jgi:surface antigen